VSGALPHGRAFRPARRTLNPNSVYEKAFGPEHVTLAAPSNNLAELYMALDEHAKAETLFLRAISIE